MDINNLKLEKFIGFGSKMSRKISVTKNFSFGLPPTFYLENGLDDYNFVELYYDSEQKVLAIHFLKEKTDACFKLIKYGEGEKRGGSFVAKSFFTRYEIDPKKVCGKYEPQKISKDDLNDLFVIQFFEHPVIDTSETEENE